MLVLIDTNVVLRVVEPLHPVHAQAVAAVRGLRELGKEICLVPQVHYEFWVAATRPVAQNGLGMSTAEAERAGEIRTTLVPSVERRASSLRLLARACR